jgi:undecaprenyl-diphosphatase
MATRGYRDHGTALLPGSARRPAVALVVGCVAVTALLGVRYRDQTRAGRLDTVIDGLVRAVLAEHPTPLNLLVHLGDPVPLTVMTAALLLTCLASRRWRAAALVAIAVPVAATLTKLLLQPLIHRTSTGGVTFPSGHATGVFALAVTVAVLLVNPPRTRPAGRVRAVLAVAAIATAGTVAVALIALNFHYATDTVGGAALATAVALLTALLLDAAGSRPATEARRQPD